MIRAAVLSDTHARSADVAKVIERLSPHLEEVDHILHAGDVVCREMLDALETFAPLDAVAGNMDGPSLNARLPERTVVNLDGKRIGLMHGWGSALDLPRKVFERFCGPDGKPEVDIVIFGHSHAPLLEYRQGTLLLNPGSPTHSRGAAFCTMAMIQTGRHLEARIIRL